MQQRSLSGVKAADFISILTRTNARDLHLHPDGRRLAIAFSDGVVRIYAMMP